MVEVRKLNNAEKQIIHKKTTRTGKEIPSVLDMVSYIELIPRTTLCTVYYKDVLSPVAYGISIRSKRDNYSSTTAQNLSFSRAIDKLFK